MSIIHDEIIWRFKIAAKLLLSRIPLPPSVWRRVGVFRDGNMHQAGYAHRVWQRHHAQYLGLRPGQAAPMGAALEIGPGDGLLSAVFAAAAGFPRVWLIDRARQATEDIAPYREAVCVARSVGLGADRTWCLDTLPALLANCNATYLTDGLGSLRELPERSVDFCFSHTVLQHVRRAEFDELIGELYRVTRPGGVHSHRIALYDCIAYSLNNLRFSERLWEAPWFATSAGFYTNRLRYSACLDAFQRAGFVIESSRAERWSALPIPKHRLAPEFRDMPDEELLVRGLDIVLRRP